MTANCPLETIGGSATLIAAFNRKPSCPPDRASSAFPSRRMPTTGCRMGVLADRPAPVGARSSARVSAPRRRRLGVTGRRQDHLHQVHQTFPATPTTPPPRVGEDDDGNPGAGGSAAAHPGQRYRSGRRAHTPQYCRLEHPRGLSSADDPGALQAYRQTRRHWKGGSLARFRRFPIVWPARPCSSTAA